MKAEETDEAEVSKVLIQGVVTKFTRNGSRVLASIIGLQLCGLKEGEGRIRWGRE